MTIIYLLYQLIIITCYYDLEINPDENPNIRRQSITTWRFYEREILRPEIISLTFLRMMATFGQICLEVFSVIFIFPV